MADEVIPPILKETKRRDAKAGMIVVAVAAVILLVTQGPNIRDSGQDMERGVIRTAVLAVGEPSGWLGDKLPFHDWAEDATAFLSPDEDFSGEGGFAQGVNETSGVPPVTESAFTPEDVGETAEPRGLRKLLVTGDSMSQGLDAALARELTDGNAVQVERDPHLGSGITKDFIVDWAALSRRQTAQVSPDAVVIVIGADDTDEIDGVACCGVDWAAAYGTRARVMMENYRQDGRTKVYWLSLPLARRDDLRAAQQVINASIRAAAAPYRRDVEILDMTTLFTPNGAFRDEMEIDGKEQLVRDADGVHWNDRGDALAADEVLRAMAQDFESIPEP